MNLRKWVDLSGAVLLRNIGALREDLTNAADRIEQLERKLAATEEREAILTHARDMRVQELNATIDILEQTRRELAEAQRDAGRFRWIAAHVYSTGHTSGPNMDAITHWGFDAPDDEFWASIDAAMADKARGA